MQFSYYLTYDEDYAAKLEIQYPMLNLSLRLNGAFDAAQNRPWRLMSTFGATATHSYVLVVHATKEEEEFLAMYLPSFVHSCKTGLGLPS